MQIPGRRYWRRSGVFIDNIWEDSYLVSHKKQNLFVQSHKTAAFGDKSRKHLAFRYLIHSQKKSSR